MPADLRHGSSGRLRCQIISFGPLVTLLIRNKLIVGTRPAKPPFDGQIDADSRQPNPVLTDKSTGIVETKYRKDR